MLRRAGLGPGDELQVEASGPGRIVLKRARDVIAQYAGCLTGMSSRKIKRLVAADRVALAERASLRRRWGLKTRRRGGQLKGTVAR